MSYTPPFSDSLHFDFTTVQWCLLSFNFSATYTPPSSPSLFYNFTSVLFPLSFEFAPEVPPPISKEMLLSLGLRFHGQVYKYWVCYVSHGKQFARRYWEGDGGNTAHLSEYSSKFASGMKAWHNLSDSDKLFWRRIGVRWKKPVTSHNAFLSAWMKDKVSYYESLRP